jgi:hypothetical protein
MRACLSLAFASLNFPNGRGRGEGRRVGEEEGEGEIHNIPRLNDQAPAGPDETCACQGHVLCEGELFGGAVEVGDASEDEAPLNYY